MAAPSPRTRRPALVALVTVGALGCLALGWWQLERYNAAGGSAQNLGYALQWPLFAAFLVYAYRRFVKLEGSDAPPPEPETVPEDLLPPRPQARTGPTGDAELDAYNAYLAGLAANDQPRPAHRGGAERNTT